jgi:hypothetical protein
LVGNVCFQSIQDVSSIYHRFHSPKSSSSNIKPALLPTKKDYCLSLTTSDSETEVSNLIKGATYSIDLALHTLTNRKIAIAIYNATVSKKLRLRVILDKPKKSTTSLSRLQIKLARKLGSLENADIREHSARKTAPFMNHNFCIIDGNTLMNGTANWPQTHTKTYGEEININVFYGLEHVAFFQKLFDDMWEVDSNACMFGQADESSDSSVWNCSQTLLAPRKITEALNDGISLGKRTISDFQNELPHDGDIKQFTNNPNLSSK